MRMWTWIGRSPARAMPMATPVMASSDSGVPKTRSGPYFSSQAARRALDGLGIVHVETEDDHRRVAGHLLVGRLADGLDVGERPVASVASRLCAPARSSRRGHPVESAGGMASSSLKTSVVSSAASGNGLASAKAKASAISASTSRSIRARCRRSSSSAEPLHLVGRHPGLGLVLGAVAEVVILAGADVLAPAVGHHLEEARAARRADRGPSTCAQPARAASSMSLPSMRSAGMPWARGAVADVGQSLPAALVRVDGVAVVFADEEDRQLLEDGEVQALGEDAFLGRPVAEEADHDRVLPAVA